MINIETGDFALSRDKEAHESLVDSSKTEDLVGVYATSSQIERLSEKIKAALLAEEAAALLNVDG